MYLVYRRVLVYLNRQNSFTKVYSSRSWKRKIYVNRVRFVFEKYATLQAFLLMMIKTNVHKEKPKARFSAPGI